MPDESVWDYFTEQLRQADFERRCFSKKLRKFELWDRGAELVLQIVTPSSGIGAIIAEHTQNTYVDIAWKSALALVSILALIRPWLLTAKVRALQSSAQSLLQVLSRFKVVLDDAHYEDINDDEWIQKARKATNEYSALSFNEEFDPQTLTSAQEETQALYRKKDNR